MCIRDRRERERERKKVTVTISNCEFVHHCCLYLCCILCWLCQLSPVLKNVCLRQGNNVVDSCAQLISKLKDVHCHHFEYLFQFWGALTELCSEEPQWQFLIFSIFSCFSIFLFTVTHQRASLRSMHAFV